LKGAEVSKTANHNSVGIRIKPVQVREDEREIDLSSKESLEEPEKWIDIFIKLGAKKV